MIRINLLIVEKTDLITFIGENLSSVSYDNNNFLYILSVYLESLYNEDVDDFEDEFKIYLPLIKKAIKSLENNFDKVFLLVFEKNTGLFLEKENRNLFDCLEFLVEKLGENNYINEAEKLNHLKVKFSLGYERYFVFSEKDILLKSISEINFNFEMYSKFDLKNEFEVLRVLNYYLENDKLNENELDDFNLYLTYLEEFPLKVYRNDNLHLFDIQKSLFFYSEFEEKEFEDGKIKSCQFNSIEVCSKILQILNKNE